VLVPSLVWSKASIVKSACGRFYTAFVVDALSSVFYVYQQYLLLCYSRL